MAIGTILFIVVCLVIAVSIMAFAWFFVFNKKDGLCEVLGEGNDGRLEILKSNVPYKFVGRVSGKPDAQHIAGYKDFKPIPKTYAIPWLNKRTNKMYILRDKDGFMHPCVLEWDENEKCLRLKPDYRETIDWIVTEFDEKDKIKEKQTGMDKFLQYAPNVIMMALLLMGMVLWWQHEDKMMTAVTGSTNQLDAKLEAAKNTYDPMLMRKAANIVAQYNVERGTVNWTTTTIQQGSGIQVNT